MPDEESRIIMRAGSVSVDADPSTLARLFHELAVNKEFRAAFEKNPGDFLAECGIDVPDHVRRRITPELVAAAVAEAGGGSEDRVAAIVAPGVAPAIRVGTRPGTSPGVRVGVSVATGSSVFAVRPRTLDDMPFTEALQRDDY